MLFGGANHQVYLGCVTCNKYHSESIWNQVGNYGNQFNPNSIWNKFGLYGNPYSQYSPWNPLASLPPVVVDQNGNFYGYFTANKLHPRRTTIPILVRLLNIPR